MQTIFTYIKCREITLPNSTENCYIILYDLVSRFGILRHADPFFYIGRFYC